MNAELFALHLRAGQHYGYASTCGQKNDYRSKPTAVRAAEAMSRKTGRALEAYPCYWCSGWHIGRELTPEEITYFTLKGSDAHGTMEAHTRPE